MLERYTLSSPHINNASFHFDCDERKDRKEHTTSEKKMQI